MYIIAYWDYLHQFKLANRGTPGIWVGFAKGHPVHTYHVNTPKTKKLVNQRHDFPTHGDWSKVDKPVMVPTGYEGLDDDDEVETVPTNNNDDNICYNIVSGSKSNEEAKENLFEEINDKIKVTPKTTLNPKW